MKTALQILFLFGLLAIASLPVNAQQDEDVKRLADWMSGIFSNETQAKADASFKNVRMYISPIWKNERNDLAWLYVEQALAKQKDKPYRQRIYRIKRVSEEVIAEDEFLLPDPGKFVGAWQNPLMFKELEPADLTLKEGCTVFLEYDGFANYSGSTMDEKCKIDYSDAVYSTSKITVMPEQIIMWRRGFDKNDKQVWGSKKSGYKFENVSE